jgi:hypothetical protein
MTDLVILPDIIRPSITFLRTLDPVTALVADRVGTDLPAQEAWPAVRLDPAGGVAPIEFRLDQPRIQVQCFALTDLQAAQVARTVRAGFVAMNGLYVPGVLCVTDVTTSGISFVKGALRDSKLTRPIPISHATFAVNVTVRPDP